MPNHFHAVVVIEDVATSDMEGSRPILGDIIGTFKSLTTNAYIRGVYERHWVPFNSRRWQRNYYERIIRDEDELRRTREYVAGNPTQWADDEENPDRATTVRT